MLSSPGPLPTGNGWTYEVKWNGFRAVVSTEDGLRVRSWRGWRMTSRLPELETLPPGLVLDGELVAWKNGVPHFPDVCRRLLWSDLSVPLTYVIFDLLRLDGEDIAARPYQERRDLLEALGLQGPTWVTPEAFDDGPSLWAAVCEYGLEGVIAKKLTSRYQPGQRGWVKVKNRKYWRRESELESMQQAAERRNRRRAKAAPKVAAAT